MKAIPEPKYFREKVQDHSNSNPKRPSCSYLSNQNTFAESTFMLTPCPDASWIKMVKYSSGKKSKPSYSVNGKPSGSLKKKVTAENKTTTKRKSSPKIIPVHNCITRIPDDGDAFSPDWKPFPFIYKGNTACKRNYGKEHLPPDRSSRIYPSKQYISDHRPCGVTRQQLDSDKRFIKTVIGISLSRLLNGFVGYRTYSGT